MIDSTSDMYPVPELGDGTWDDRTPSEHSEGLQRACAEIYAEAVGEHPLHDAPPPVPMSPRAAPATPTAPATAPATPTAPAVLPAPAAEVPPATALTTFKPLVRPGTPAAALTTHDLGPDHVLDVLGDDDAKRQRAQTQRQAQVVAAWAAEPRALVMDLNPDHAGEPEPDAYAAVADALATGCDSPLAARAMLGQILHVAQGLRGSAFAEDADKQAAIRTIRARVQALRPTDATDGMLACNLVMFQQALGHVVFRISAASSAIELDLCASALEKLTRAQLDLLRTRDRRQRPRRQPGQRIVVQDQAQAVFGDIHAAPSR